MDFNEHELALLDRIRSTGAARYRDLLTAGFTQSQIRRLTNAGALERVAHGVYALPGPDFPRRAALAHGTHLTCISALDLFKITGMVQDSRLHVTRMEPADGFVVHRRRSPPLAMPGLVTASAAVADALRCMPPMEAHVRLESALGKGVRRSSILAHLPGPTNGRLRTMVLSASAEAGSALETVGRLLLREKGLQVEVQKQISGVGRVDFLVEGRVIVELDGYEFHADKEQFQRDRERTNAAQLAGYTCLRFTYADVIHRPEAFTRSVREAVRRARALRAPR